MFVRTESSDLASVTRDKVNKSSLSITTDSGGIALTGLLAANIFILSVQLNAGYVDRFVSVGLYGGEYRVKVTNGAGAAAGNQTITVDYTYINI